MKSETITLPDETYYDLQQRAAEAHKDTDEYIKQLLLENADYEVNNTDSNGDLRQLILDWNWPQKQPKEGDRDTQLNHVVGVIEEMDAGYTFSEATRRRAKEAPTDSEHYHQSVRAACTKKDQGVAHGVREFKKEAADILDSYHSEAQ
jgi:hypothetical protein